MEARAKGRALLAYGACLTGLLAVPAGAQAAVAEYAPAEAARSFDSGSAGWTGSTAYDGLCLAPLTCPTVTNEHRPGGGSGGGGYLQTTLSGLTGISSTSSGVFQSPSFVYRGVGGIAPDKLSLNLDRRSDVGALISVAGNRADYSVSLLDETSGLNVDLGGPSQLGGADSWTAAQALAIDPSRVQVGHTYRIAITTRFTTGATVIDGGSADYDNVVLRATTSDPGDGGQNGVSMTRREAKAALVSGFAQAAALKGNRLTIRVRCPKRMGRACQIRTTGLRNRGGKAVTRTKRVRVGAGRSQTVLLGVKPAYREFVGSKRRLLFRQVLRSGGLTVRATKGVRIVKR